MARAAFLAQYRFGLDFIQRAENDPKLALLLNDPVPELGLPRGSYDKLKLRHLNVAASSLSRTEKAVALARAFRYVGRPYDFDFDFQTDSALVCTELVYKAYEPAPGFRGLRLRLEEIVGRTAIPANAIARQFDEELARGAAQFEMVLFLDGQERRKTAVEAGIEDFRRSWRRPKWHVLTGTLGDRGRTAGR